MAQTIVTKTPENLVRMATGTYLDTGTVAAYDFEDLGFKPRYIRVINTTSGDEECWIEGMTAAHAFKRIAAGTGAATTSLGLTVTDRGFTFGLDTDMNVASEQVYWVALG
jgi:hypothetical protein